MIFPYSTSVQGFAKNPLLQVHYHIVQAGRLNTPLPSHQRPLPPLQRLLLLRTTWADAVQSALARPESPWRLTCAPTLELTQSDPAPQGNATMRRQLTIGANLHRGAYLAAVSFCVQPPFRPPPQETQETKRSWLDRGPIYCVQGMELPILLSLPSCTTIVADCCASPSVRRPFRISSSRVLRHHMPSDSGLSWWQSSTITIPLAQVHMWARLARLRSIDCGALASLR